MNAAVMTFRLQAPWAHSLKEERMIVKSRIARMIQLIHSADELGVDGIWSILLKTAIRVLHMRKDDNEDDLFSRGMLLGRTEVFRSV
mgnify:CR=1 FL=1